ncbi:MAG: hypothetical protein HY855_02720 [Burkholderiales bacterium]|nr:hypothetical protein [Burkholderiales bacterium]
MKNIHNLAADLEREAHQPIQRAGAMLATASALRAAPMGNLPTAEIRHHLAVAGFAVISRDALMTLEASVDDLEFPSGAGVTEAKTAARDAIVAAGAIPIVNTEPR